MGAVIHLTSCVATAIKKAQQNICTNTYIHIHFNGCTHTLAYLITVTLNTRDPLSGKTVICLCVQQCASPVERDGTHTHMYTYIDVITLCRDVRTCKLAHTHTNVQWKREHKAKSLNIKCFKHPNTLLTDILDMCTNKFSVCSGCQCR